MGNLKYTDHENGMIAVAVAEYVINLANRGETGTYMKYNFLLNKILEYLDEKEEQK